MPIPSLRLVTPPTPSGSHSGHDNPPVLILIGANGDAIRLDDRRTGIWCGAYTKAIFGLGPTEVRQSEAYGDGATYGGKRRAVRPIDMRIHVASETEKEQRDRLQRLEDVVDDDRGVTLQVICPECGVDNARLIGLQYSDGWDGATDVGTLQKFTKIPFTFLALEPYFRASLPLTYKWVSTSSKAWLSATDPFFPAELAESQVLGAVSITNPGKAPAYAKWTISGPGGPVTISSPSGTMVIDTTLGPADMLIADSAGGGTLVTASGDDAYHLLGPSPDFWRIPPGVSQASVSMDNAVAGSSIVLEFTPRYKRGM